MPYIVVTTLFPYEKAPQCGEKYMEALKKYPLDESLGTDIVPSAVKLTLEGNKSIRIVEVKEGKMEEALIHISRSITVFRGIEGFKPSIDIYYTVAEAMAIAGVKSPDE